MNTETPHTKVRITDLDPQDMSELIRANLDKLGSDYVIVDDKTKKVLVKDGSPADVRFKEAKAGNIVPLGIVEQDGVTYRLYLVSPDLL